MWQTLGHNPAKQLLDKQLERAQFPHAYLFVGPQGIGKQMLAREMAQKILKCEENLSSHADFIHYDAADSNGMDGLRQFMARLANKPFVGAYKVAVIDNMDSASMQMSNALLKTLEEPSPSTILFVVAHKNNLLPTIVSRCQKLTFNPLTIVELQLYAEIQKTSNIVVSEQLFLASFGSPARLNLLLDDKELVEQINAGVVQLEQAYTSGVAERLLAVSALAELEPEQLQDILLTWLYQQRSALAREPRRGRVIAAICEALEHLNASFNKKMILQRLLLQSYETA